MHAGKYYSIRQIVRWTRREIVVFILIAFTPTFLYEVFDLKWLTIPWLPVALIGTALAFIIGFKNNASYDRLWEARKIWGSIVNLSRTWGIMVRDFINNFKGSISVSDSQLKEIHTRLIYRHISWLTALRFQLR
jgi:putative membrane protein